MEVLPFTILIPVRAKHNPIPLRLAPFNLLPFRHLLPWKFSAAQSVGVDSLGASKGNVTGRVPKETYPVSRKCFAFQWKIESYGETFLWFV